MDLKELTLVNPETNWYYQSKLHAIKSLMRQHKVAVTEVIDVGAGSGFFGKSVISQNSGSKLFCVDTNYEKAYVGDTGIEYLKSSHGVVGNLYLFIDVLEHVDNDVELVREYIANAPKGATIIITVPAFMSLWSAHDIFLEHKKRYRKIELLRICEELGLEKLETGYLFSLIFPIVYLERKLSKNQAPKSSMREFNKPTNLLLKTLSKIEHQYFRNSFFGLSTYLIAKK